MKIKSKTFSYAIKKSVDYNSVSVGESIEVSLEGEAGEIATFNKIKDKLMERVDKRVENYLNPKPTNLLSKGVEK